MTKDRNNRYRNMDELMTDLQAVREGRPPLLARQKFNVEALESLEEGMALETMVGDENMYSEELIGKYRMFVIILGVLSAMLGLAVLLLLILMLK